MVSYLVGRSRNNLFQINASGWDNHRVAANLCWGDWRQLQQRCDTMRLAHVQNVRVARSICHDIIFGRVRSGQSTEVKVRAICRRVGARSEHGRLRCASQNQSSARNHGEKNRRRRASRHPQSSHARPNSMVSKLPFELMARHASAMAMAMAMAMALVTAWRCFTVRMKGRES